MRRLVNIHQQFFFGHALVVTGILLISLIILTQIIFVEPPDYVTDHIKAGIAFGICGLISGISIHLARKTASYSFFAHGLPYLAFPVAMLVSGNDSRAMPIILVIALIANVYFLYANGKADTYEEGSDLITIYFRFPF